MWHKCGRRRLFPCFRSIGVISSVPLDLNGLIVLVAHLTLRLIDHPCRSDYNPHCWLCIFVGLNLGNGLSIILSQFLFSCLSQYLWRLIVLTLFVACCGLIIMCFGIAWYLTDPLTVLPVRSFGFLIFLILTHVDLFVWIPWCELSVCSMLVHKHTPAAQHTLIHTWVSKVLTIFWAGLESSQNICGHTSWYCSVNKMLFKNCFSVLPTRVNCFKFLFC